VAPAIIDHPHFRLQNLCSDLRVEINLRDQEIATSLFSANVVLPAGDWITAFFKGTLSFGEHSVCTIVQSGMYVETEFSNIDRQVLQAIRTALGVDNSAFRALLDESLSRAFHCVARSVMLPCGSPRMVRVASARWSTSPLIRLKTGEHPADLLTNQTV
jgi:hypothetical protein